MSSTKPGASCASSSSGAGSSGAASGSGGRGGAAPAHAWRPGHAALGLAAPATVASQASTDAARSRGIETPPRPFATSRGVSSAAAATIGAREEDKSGAWPLGRPACAAWPLTFLEILRFTMVSLRRPECSRTRRQRWRLPYNGSPLPRETRSPANRARRRLKHLHVFGKTAS